MNLNGHKIAIHRHRFSIITAFLPDHYSDGCSFSFLRQARPLTTNELGEPKISCKIAEKMAKIHSLNIPVSKEPDWLWNTIERWLQNLEEILKSYPNKTADEKVTYEKMRKIDFRRELDWLKSVVQEADYPVVFCHNDLQEGNILFKEQNSGFASPGSSTEQLRWVDWPIRSTCRCIRYHSMLFCIYISRKAENILPKKHSWIQSSFSVENWKAKKFIEIL